MQYVLFTRRRPCSKIYSPSLLIIRCAVLPCPSIYIYVRTPMHHAHPSHWSVYYPGIVFFHRFYMLQSFANGKFNRWYMAAACLFLAGKVGEQPKKIKPLISVLHQYLPRQNVRRTPLHMRLHMHVHVFSVGGLSCFAWLVPFFCKTAF